MARLTRKQMEVLNVIFDEFALADQRRYYKNALSRNEKAGSQVNRIRATLALFTGLSAALAGLVVSSVFPEGARCTAQVIATADASYCGLMTGLTGLFSLVAIIAPALSGAFGTLADLYQWDRLADVYANATKTLAVADAYSPVDAIPDDLTYRASLNAFAQGTLNVMEDESAQWGALIRQPEEIDKFIAAQRANVQQNIDTLNRNLGRG